MASTEYINDLSTIMDIAAKSSDEAWTKIAIEHNFTADEFVQYLNDAGYTVVRNPNGSILNISKQITAEIPQSAAAEAAEAVNSNLQTGTATFENTATFNQLGNTTLTDAGTVTATAGATVYKTGELASGVSFSVGQIVAPLLAVGTGIQLGKAIDSTIYNIGNAMGLNPPSALDPSTWNTITADFDDTAGEKVLSGVFNMLFGIDPNTNKTTAYVEENAMAYMSRYLQTLNFFSNPTYSTEKPSIPDTFSDSTKELLNSINSPIIPLKSITYEQQNSAIQKEQFIFPEIEGVTYFYVSWSSGFGLAIVSQARVEITYTDIIITNGRESSSTRTLTIETPVKLEGLSYYTNFINRRGITENSYPITMPSTTITQYDDYIAWALAYCYYNGTVSEVGGAPDGVSTADGATVPDISTGLTQEEMLAKLKELYPELWQNRVENSVVQPDGTVKTYVYIPMQLPNEGLDTNAGSKTETQGDNEIDANTATDTQIATLLKLITQSMNNPQGMTDPETQPKTNPLNGNDNPNPTNTGGGDTPVVTLPTGQASSLYAIYNPTLAQVNSLGAWLWSSDFIDQILKLFSDPMQAIIGLHKIYCTPSTDAEQNIKVGYLDSGVSSKVVSSQYTTVDCGSVSLKEYFGNVFDYDPYTQIRLYLPFIGIVPLDTADAMRGTISVIYHVDVLSGACLAEVKITRDSAGGTIYQYAGNAAVTMPISSGSYIGVIANVVGVASSVVGGFASGGALGAVAGGVTGALSHRGGTSIQHSGNFSGNAGAMGIKKPYLIIERPQTALAKNYNNYVGIPSNDTVVLNTCSGYIKCTEVHLENIPATGDELTEIENYLKNGVIV